MNSIFLRGRGKVEEAEYCQSIIIVVVVIIIFIIASLKEFLKTFSRGYILIQYCTVKDKPFWFDFPENKCKRRLGGSNWH